MTDPGKRGKIVNIHLDESEDRRSTSGNDKHERNIQMDNSSIDESDEESQSNESSCESDASDVESLNSGSEGSDGEDDDTTSSEIMNEDSPEDNGVAKKNTTNRKSRKQMKARKARLLIERQSKEQ